MNQSKYINRIKQRIRAQERTKRIYPEFTESANRIINRLREELKTLNHFKRIAKKAGAPC